MKELPPVGATAFVGGKAVAVSAAGDEALRALMRRLGIVSNLDVQVGYVGEDPDRKDTGEGITNASLAYIHENGSPAQGIPARPFLKTVVSQQGQTIKTILPPAIGRALKDGDANAVPQAMAKVGMALVSQAQENLREQRGFEPLKPETLHRRKTRKIAPRTGVKALIDTGQLLQGIHYVLTPSTGRAIRGAQNAGHERPNRLTVRGED